MEAPLLGAPSPARPEDRLDSWKEIAAYFKRDVTTVQRWEKREGMPVHRHLHDRMGSVHAFREELDAWARSRNPVSLEQADDANGNAASPPAPTADPGPKIPPDRSPRSRWAPLPAVVLIAAVGLAALVGLRRSEYFWRSPIADAQVQAVTDFDGISESVAISRDGRLVAFLSDRDGPMDIWLTQAGSGEFHNLTRGSLQGLVNPLIRALAFSPDSSLVTYWVKPGREGRDETSIWAIPILGGPPRPYLEGVAEYDWSPDGSQVAFHTSSPGDPLYVSPDGRVSGARLLFQGSAGTHSHFPVWSPDGAYLYFVHGSVPDKLDIWRVSPRSLRPERITFHNAKVMYPEFLDPRTLIYLATDADGSGPWLYSLDVERRVPHRLTLGPDRYTSLAAGADGGRIVATLASEKPTLWRLGLADAMTGGPARIALGSGTGSSPRLGPGYLLYVWAGGVGDELWKSAGGLDAQLWRVPGAYILGTAISPDGSSIALSVREGGRTRLYTLSSDGTHPRLLSDSLDLDGAPAWSPDGRFLAIAVKQSGVSHLVKVSVADRSVVPLVSEESVDPAWSPDGTRVLYSGPDIGTRFAVKSLEMETAMPPLPPLTLTRGARHLMFLPGGKTVIFLAGDLQHRDLWQMDMQTGVRRPLTHLAPDFDVRDFDISSDGREVVLERAQSRSEVMLLDRSGARPRR